MAGVIMPHRVVVVKQLAQVFSALSHLVRVRIVLELREGELCVNSLQSILGIRQSAVSQHLALLKSQNLIKERREGRNVLYRLASPELASWLVESIPLIVPEDTDFEDAPTKSTRQKTLSVRSKQPQIKE
jgi:DNA-binding transcriptional ArsR family regulator